jgi:hypothetical protein
VSSERCTLGGGRSDPDIPSDDVMICDRGIYVKVIKLIIISIVLLKFWLFKTLCGGGRSALPAALLSVT